MYMVLSVSTAKVGKYKQALNFMEISHNVVQGLHTPVYHSPRNIDYLLAANTLTAYLLIKSSKLEEALSCLEFAEKLIFLQVKYTLEDEKPPQVAKYLTDIRKIQEDLQESNKPFVVEIHDAQTQITRFLESKESQRLSDSKTGHDEYRRQLKEDALVRLKKLGAPPKVKQSKMSMTLIQNYILAICLMKNIALKFIATKTPTVSNKRAFQVGIKKQIEELSEVEAVMILKKQQSLRPNGQGRSTGIPHSRTKNMVPIEQGMMPLSEEISVSYLIIQHKKEMLDQNLPFRTVLAETLDAEFVKMLYGCLFVPFLHEETPQKCVIPLNRESADKYAFVPSEDEVKYMLSIRKKALDALERKYELTERSRQSRLEQDLHKQKILEKAIDRANKELD